MLNQIKDLFLASDIKSIVLTSGFDNSLDDQNLIAEYLWYGNTYEDRSFYKCIKALLPGHVLVIDQNSHKLIQMVENRRLFN